MSFKEYVKLALMPITWDLLLENAEEYWIARD